MCACHSLQVRVFGVCATRIHKTRPEQEARARTSLAARVPLPRSPSPPAAHAAHAPLPSGGDRGSHRHRWIHRLRGRGVRGERGGRRQRGKRVARRGEGREGRSGELAPVGGVLGAVACEGGADLAQDHVQVAIQVALPIPSPSLPWPPARPARHAPRQGALPRLLLLPLAARTRCLSLPVNSSPLRPDTLYPDFRANGSWTQELEHAAEHQVVMARSLLPLPLPVRSM